MLRWLLLAVFAFLVGCSGRKSASYDYAPPMEAYAEDGYRLSAGPSRSRKQSAGAERADYGGADLDDEMSHEEVPAPQDGEEAGTPAATRMVHYDGFARLRVTRVEDGVDQVRAVAEALGGHVERVGSSSVSVRVPVAVFRDAFDQVLELGEVLDKSLTAQDVTDAFTSVDLRLKTAEATRERLQILLARSEEEQEKLQLIRQIQRLTEEIDRLGAQVRTLSGLAELSRISVELVPREALAWQGPEDETAELAWIRDLSPLRTSAPFESKELDLAVPEGMVRLEPRGPYVAESPDGARIWSHRVRNEPQGDAAFWLSALEGRLARDFGAAETETVGGWQVLRLTDKGDDPYTWLLAVRVEGSWLHLVQVMTPSPDATERYDAAIRGLLSGAAA